MQNYKCRNKEEQMKKYRRTNAEIQKDKKYLGDWKLKPRNPVFSSFRCELHKEGESLPDQRNAGEVLIMWIVHCCQQYIIHSSLIKEIRMKWWKRWTTFSVVNHLGPSLSADFFFLLLGPAPPSLGLRRTWKVTAPLLAWSWTKKLSILTQNHNSHPLWPKTQCMH